MSVTDTEKRWSPAIILALVAALLLVLGLWTYERMTGQSVQSSAAPTAVAGSSQKIKWKMVTTWPKNFPGLGSAAETFARLVDEMSSGRMTVHVYGAGELVPPFEVFDAVSQGVADAGHGAAYYWKGKVPASVFFTAIPFGMTAQEMNGWYHYGGGIELWRELYEPFNLVPFSGGSTGVQMAGWFNKELNSPDDLVGLKMRIPGLAGEVFARAGGSSVRIAGGELYTSLETGVIDAAEWVGPFNDLTLGLHQVAKYYYYPGWHEPGAMLEIIINKTSLETLPPDLQAIVTAAARAANQDMLDEFTARNNTALKELVDVHGVELRRLPDSVLQALAKASNEVLGELIAADPMAAKIYKSFSHFYGNVRDYHQISERAYINAREVVADELLIQSP
ncbi:MAG: TRAP transporter substrate-binding protein [Aequoribacter sp.]|jgi:TRAP-type mannitol/chloroaromatic compound transport system substrate-binding protein|uniref:TRAP transporter substrate-binding protein n=1 Tax=Aequoribacter sp. TaxID=2847771 RepID=UPI003C370B76